MSIALNISKTFSLGGKTFNETRSLSGAGLALAEASIPAAKAGTLSTRTSDSVGTLTLGAGHGIETGNVITIFWGSVGYRRLVTVGTVSGTSVPLTNSGSGDVLPDQGTAVTVMVPTALKIPVPGSAAIAALVLFGEAISLFTLKSSAPAVIEHRWHALAGISKLWFPQGIADGTGDFIDDDVLNGGDLATVDVSHNAVAAKVMRIAALYN